MSEVRTTASIGQQSNHYPTSSSHDARLAGLGRLDQQPPYCECARVGKRPLSWGTWIPNVSSGKRNGVLDRNNIEFSHEHVLFDQSGDNFGFGPDGVFSEDTSKFEYRLDQNCYDGQLMRQIYQKLKLSKPYRFIGNNCQDFIDRVRELIR